MRKVQLGAATYSPTNMSEMVAVTASRVTPLSPGRRSAGRLVTLEDLLDIVAGLAVRRDAAVALHRAGTGVVGGQRPLEVTAVLADERVQVTRAAIQVGGGIQGILD